MKKRNLKSGHEVVSAVKQWSFKGFGSFTQINCMNEYLLIDSVFTFVGTK